MLLITHRFHLILIVVALMAIVASSIQIPDSEEVVLKLPSQRIPDPEVRPGQSSPVKIQPYAEYVAEQANAKAQELSYSIIGAVKYPFLMWLHGRGHGHGGQSGATPNAVFTVYNNCPYTIWPATLNSGGGQISSSGFELPSWHVATLNAPPQWSGRLWARFQCSWGNSGFRCNSGDCGSGQIPCNGHGGAPPATLAEFTLSGSGNQDFFDVSLVDGYNLPIRIEPDGGCGSASCPVDINAVCPDELSIWDNNGGKIGCKSACVAFNQPQYCCSPPNNTPSTCPPTDYSRYFKGLCPQAYSYAYDDPSSTFTCGAGRSYTITWCP